MNTHKHNLKLLFRIAFSLIAAAALFVSVLVVTGNSADADKAKSCTCGTLIDVIFAPEVPGDNKLVTGQVQANCFAWSEFVALNWPTAPDARFGTPGDFDPVQWETYMTREVLLPVDGSAPPAWNDWKTPKAPEHLEHHLDGHPEGIKLLYHRSKHDDDFFSILDENGQAFPGDGRPNWLGAQNNTNIWYEVLVNEDFYNYVVENEFYDARKQYEYVVVKGDTMALPSGDEKQVGALELKASWMEITDTDNPRWDRYKRSKSVVVDAQTGQSRLAEVALIGLHILHKTASQPTWFWATFEHIDNVPGDGHQSEAYNLHDPNCQAKKVNVPANCGENTNRADSTYTVGCEPNQIPSYHLCQGAAPVAVQVSREIPIDPEAAQANAQMQQYIAQNFPGSVWSNYQLVNMVWSTTPQTVQSNRTPQGLKSMQPVIPVANTASETYIQGTTCFGCHQFANIATVKGQSGDNGAYASDFSFVFKFAGTSE